VYNQEKKVKVVSKDCPQQHEVLVREHTTALRPWAKGDASNEGFK
jgi:hypothetical protein